MGKPELYSGKGVNGMLSLLTALFGGAIAGWAGHALYIRPNQLKGLPPVVAGSIEAVDQGVVIPAVDSAIGSATTVLTQPVLQIVAGSKAAVKPTTGASCAVPTPSVLQALQPDSSDNDNLDDDAPPRVSSTFD